MTHPTLGPSPHAHSENLVLQSCSSSPVSSTEKATWSPAKTTSNALAVSWCRKTAGVPCLWMILKGKPPLSTYYDQNFVNLFEISSFLTSSCHISSTHPSQPPRCQVSYPKRWLGTYLQPWVTDKVISLRPEKDSYSRHVSFWPVSKISAWLIHE